MIYEIKNPQLYSIEIESDKIYFVNAYFQHFLHNGTYKNVIIVKKRIFLNHETYLR